jgi:tight adherence protein B
MMSPSLFAAMAFFLASVSVGGLATAVFYPRLAKPKPFRQRFQRIAALPVPHHEPLSVDNARDRKRAVEKTLLELEAKQKAGAKNSSRPSLKVRMRQAGLNWTIRTYFFSCICAGLLSYTIAFASGISTVAALGFGLAGGLMLPHFFVNGRRKSRNKRFTAEFPNAVDVVVRGLKAGLPVADCMKVIAAEAQEPVKSEFAAVVMDQTIGLPMDEAVHRLWERIPLPETSFFSIVIAIQSKTGGSLSEALGNLSKVLRERKKMQAKIKAMSSEAKTSAAIIGAMPFLVSGAVYLTSPDYMTLLFTTMAGKIVLGACALWMSTGILVMRKMINFDF